MLLKLLKNRLKIIRKEKKCTSSRSLQSQVALSHFSFGFCFQYFWYTSLYKTAFKNSSQNCHTFCNESSLLGNVRLLGICTSANPRTSHSEGHCYVDLISIIKSKSGRHTAISPSPIYHCAWNVIMHMMLIPERSWMLLQPTKYTVILHNVLQPQNLEIKTSPYTVHKWFQSEVTQEGGSTY